MTILLYWLSKVFKLIPYDSYTDFRWKEQVANNLINLYSHSSFRKAASILTRSDRLKLAIITVVQVCMGFLDLIGVLAIGALGALTVQGIEFQKPGNKVGQVLRVLHLQHLPFQSQVAFLGIFAACILIIKTIISIFFTRKVLYFLSLKGSQVSADLITKVLSQNLVELQQRTNQQILYMVSEGIPAIFTGILATTVNMASDVAMLVIISVGLFVVDPSIALATGIIFFLLAYFLYHLLQVRAKELGVNLNKFTVKSSEKIIEVLSSYRETVVRDRRQFYGQEIRGLRYHLGDVIAEQSFQPFISKYVIELSLVLGSFALAAFEFGTKNAVHAVSVLGLFMAASTRIAPAALRIQQGILTIRSCSGSSDSTFKLLEDVKNTRIINEPIRNPTFSYDDFYPEINLNGVKFRYKDSANFALNDVSLLIKSGSSTAIVGSSGAGKTTLIDLVLGVLEPDMGTVHISNMRPSEASQKWSGAISYVPQNVFISAGTIRENVAMGYSNDVATDERVWNALELAQLREVVLTLPHGLDTFVGEEGSRISGGQRQRLGIARALFTSPKLLVLDEATSALDGQTEAAISKAISFLSGKVTVLVVAHRLSTVRDFDQIIYMDGGRVISVGKFDELRSKVRDFDDQAKLMGL